MDYKTSSRVFPKKLCCTWAVGCRKFVQYILMLSPGRFILVEPVWSIFLVLRIFKSYLTLCKFSASCCNCIIIAFEKDSGIYNFLTNQFWSKKWKRKKVSKISNFQNYFAMTFKSEKKPANLLSEKNSLLWTTLSWYFVMWPVKYCAKCQWTISS